MPRVIWKGAVSFGLVTIPVQLYSAVSRKAVRFNQIDSRTGARVRLRKVSEADGTELSTSQIVKGYELPSGDYVRLTEAELESLAPEAVRTIDIDAFVDLVDIDPVFYESAYHLVPDKTAAKPYKLLAEAMQKAGKVAICRFVMRSKQHLAAVRPVEGRLMLSTMLYHDEVVSANEVGGFDALESVAVDERETAMAHQLIAALEAKFDPGRYQDSYRKSVLELIERKAAGESTDTVVPAAPTSDTVIDLMAALEASVAAAKQARTRHPSVVGDDVSDGNVTGDGVGVSAGNVTGDGVGVSAGNVTGDGVGVSAGNAAGDGVDVSDGNVTGDGVDVSDGNVTGDGVDVSDGNVTGDGVDVSEGVVTSEVSVVGDGPEASTAQLMSRSAEESSLEPVKEVRKSA